MAVVPFVAFSFPAHSRLLPAPALSPEGLLAHLAATLRPGPAWRAVMTGMKAAHGGSAAMLFYSAEAGDPGSRRHLVRPVVTGI
jgi:hypothetical protein